MKGEMKYQPFGRRAGSSHFFLLTSLSLPNTDCALARGTR